MTLPDFIYSTYNSLLEADWRMQEIDDMDMLGFLRIRAWKAKQTQKKPTGTKKCIDQVWPGLRPSH